jgi:hypothetical protein
MNVWSTVRAPVERDQERWPVKDKAFVVRLDTESFSKEVDFIRQYPPPPSLAPTTTATPAHPKQAHYTRYHPLPLPTPPTSRLTPATIPYDSGPATLYHSLPRPCTPSERRACAQVRQAARAVDERNPIRRRLLMSLPHASTGLLVLRVPSPRLSRQAPQHTHTYTRTHTHTPLASCGSFGPVPATRSGHSHDSAAPSRS